jgi:hypothetical protein
MPANIPEDNIFDAWSREPGQIYFIIIRSVPVFSYGFTGELTLFV